MPFCKRFLQHIHSSRLVSPGEKLIVAVSGGADSMALLHALYHARRELGLELIVAHYDHHLRSSSVQDRLYVKATARRLGLPFVTQINRHPAPRTGSVEEFARDLRYEFLFKTAKKHNASALLTAHTSDDLAETVLMRILRGTGLSGLQAILPRRSIRGCELVRPMLIFTRKDVEEFLKARKIKFINDPSNRSLDFDRNKIRKLIIPYLERNYHPGVKDNLSRLADIAAMDQSFIEEQADLFLKRTVKITSHSVSVPLTKLKLLHCSLRRTVLRAMFISLFGNTGPVTLAHITAIDAALFDRHTDAAFGKRPLPAGSLCTSRTGRLILSRKNPSSCS